MSTTDAALAGVLERARAAGFLGPGAVEPHVDHGFGFATAAEAALGHVPQRFADLGTGGGVPGLVLARRWTAAAAIFVDSAQRRCQFLREAIAELGLDGRVEVVEARAEVVGRSDDYREQFELVTARSFAEPAVTAEIAAGLAQVGGIVVVSEPPGSDGSRWAPEGLATLGMSPASVVEAAGARFVVIGKDRSTPERFPRGVGRPAKRPLW